MQALDNVLKRVSARRYDDDFVDRANYLYTPAMLASFALTIAAKQYVGKPIQCWAPAQFKGSWEDYAENYCFVENTYYVGMDEHFPRNKAERESREIQYYQWVPFMLAIQLLLFILPKTIWNAINWKTGLNINALSQAARPTKKTDRGHVLKDDGDKKHEVAAVKNLNKILQYQEARKRGRKVSDKELAMWDQSKTSKFSPLFVNLDVSKNFVTMIYLLFKIFNLVNCVGQLYWLNHFLGPEYTLWGWGIFVDLYHQRSWQRSGHFPRVTFCDVEVREQGGQLEKNTLQCVLMINMFNEKIFIFIWFWLVILIVSNIINFIMWIYDAFSVHSARKFVFSHMQPIENAEFDKFKYFVHDTLGRDGITCLRLIERNCGPIAVSNIIEGLWKSQDIERNLLFSKKNVTTNNFDYEPKKNQPTDLNSCSDRSPSSDPLYAEAPTLPRTYHNEIPKQPAFSISDRPQANNMNSANFTEQQYQQPPPPQFVPSVLDQLPRDFTTVATALNLADMGGHINSIASFDAMQQDLNRPTTLTTQPNPNSVNALQPSTTTTSDGSYSMIMSVSDPTTPKMSNDSNHMV